MQKILIQFAHPALSNSKMNRTMHEAVEELEGVTINDLYAEYPDFLIDIRREQALCEAHDIIIFQHPFYWYSTPSIMKEWQDLVLQHGWAYGSEGTALQGKMCLQALTAGGDDSTYQQGGYNEFTIRELTAPFHATAKLCGMKWLPPFAILGIHLGLEQVIMDAHASDYRRTVVSLRDSTFDLNGVAEEPYLNTKLETHIRKG